MPSVFCDPKMGSAYYGCIGKGSKSVEVNRDLCSSVMDEVKFHRRYEDIHRVLWDLSK